MGPKVEAALAFVRGTGGEALITSPTALRETLAGDAGTHFAAGRSGQTVVKCR